MSGKKEQKNSNENKSHTIKLYPSIKAILNIKYILSHLPLSKKLKLIIYNKQFKDKLGINMIYLPNIISEFILIPFNFVLNFKISS